MVWDGIIATYLFLAGLGAGAFALAALAGFVRPDAVKLRTIGYVIAPIAVGVGTVLLMVDAKACLLYTSASSSTTPTPRRATRSRRCGRRRCRRPSLP